LEEDDSDMAKKPTITINRSAKTGEFVTEKFAKSHPSTTEREHRPAPKRTPTKKK
jgi:hypothetical protein